MTAKLKIMLRVVRRRLEAGETLDEIFEGYPKLSEAEKAELREAVEGENG